MTIIFNNTEFWIEYHEVEQTPQVAEQYYSVFISLDKPGKFIGGSVVMSANVADVSAPLLLSTFSQELHFGDGIDSVQVRSKANVGLYLGCKVLIYLKK